jgi:hypothetical protein
MAEAKERIPTKYRVITEAGMGTDHEIMMEKKPVYDELRSLVEPHLNGARLMHVKVLCPELGQWTDMFIDDMGALKRLPCNDIANKLYRTGFLLKNPYEDPENAVYRRPRSAVLASGMGGLRCGDRKRHRSRSLAQSTPPTMLKAATMSIAGPTRGCPPGWSDGHSRFFEALLATAAASR